MPAYEAGSGDVYAVEAAMQDSDVCVCTHTRLVHFEPGQVCAFCKAACGGFALRPSPLAVRARAFLASLRSRL